MTDTTPSTTPVEQPVTDDSLKVRQLTHYQFTWVAAQPGEKGTFTLQLVLDQGAWEEVLTVDADDAEVLRELLRGAARSPSTSIAERSCLARRPSARAESGMLSSRPREEAG
jgi:hypothetical protein